MNCLKFLSIPVLSLAFLIGCEQQAAIDSAQTAEAAEPVARPTASVEPAQSTSTNTLPDMFDCVRENGGLLIASHRGGPAPGFPENAVETLAHALANDIFIMEVDVAESRDGVLFLMHDRSLGRTTTGSGAVADADWSEISALRLVDNDGKVTSYAPPTLDTALEWAVESGAIIELDRKPTTSFRNIIDAVRAAGAENNVIIITYNDDEALQVSRLAPDMMMTAGIGDRQHEAGLIEAGLNPERLIAWTGTNRPSPGKWKGLASKGIESAFGTLGRPGERLDDQYWADGNPSEFDALATGGLVMLATDVPYKLTSTTGALKRAVDTAQAKCPR